MNAIERALRDFIAARPSEIGTAIVGGIAVSARTEPRFTRDLDFAVAVDTDAAAEAYVLALRNAGYELASAIEQTAAHRLSTVRLRRGGRGPMIDLLFASSGIEREIVAAAEPLEIQRGLVAEVARVGHLIVMKLLSSSDDRPRDHDDLLQLGRVADAVEWTRAEHATRLVADRGFARGRDLPASLAALRRLSVDPDSG